MPYTLRNIATHATVTCPDDLWHRCLETARASGWDEEGTRYDFAYQVDELYDSTRDYLYNLWMIFHASREMFEWDGNYTDKMNQVVSESDAYQLMKALEESWDSEDHSLLDFLGIGQFRICAE